MVHLLNIRISSFQGNRTEIGGSIFAVDGIPIQNMHEK